MTPENFLKCLYSLKTWNRGGARALYKPLLLLLTLGHLGQGPPRMRLYREIEPELGDLLKRLGLARERDSHDYLRNPFNYLRSDGLWEIEGLQASHMDCSKQLRSAALRQSDVKGGLPSAVYQLLISNPPLFRQAVEYLLKRYFPTSYHRDLLEAVQLHAVLEVGNWPEIQKLDRENRLRRDPHFRDRVIRAYECRCAICNYDTRMYGTVIGLEATHIRWHANGGPDEVSNGLALCMIHHKAFDRGGIGLTDDFTLLISPALHGQNEAWNYWFSRFRDQAIHLPQRTAHAPDPKHLEWHRSQVFRDFPQGQ